jgi:hypothetical protein
MRIGISTGLTPAGGIPSESGRQGHLRSLKFVSRYLRPDSGSEGDPVHFALHYTTYTNQPQADREYSALPTAV